MASGEQLAEVEDWFGFAELSGESLKCKSANTTSTTTEACTKQLNQNWNNNLNAGTRTGKKIDQNEIVVPIVSNKQGKTKYKVLARQKVEDEEPKTEEKIDNSFSVSKTASPQSMQYVGNNTWRGTYKRFHKSFVPSVSSVKYIADSREVKITEELEVQQLTKETLADDVSGNKKKNNRKATEKKVSGVLEKTETSHKKKRKDIQNPEQKKDLSETDTQTKTVENVETVDTKSNNESKPSVSDTNTEVVDQISEQNGRENDNETNESEQKTDSPVSVPKQINSDLAEVCGNLCTVKLKRDPSIDMLHNKIDNRSETKKSTEIEELNETKEENVVLVVAEGEQPTCSDEREKNETSNFMRSLSSDVSAMKHLSLKRPLSMDDSKGISMIYNADHVHLRKSGRLRSAKCSSRYRGDYGIRVETYSKLVHDKCSVEEKDSDIEMGVEEGLSEGTCKRCATVKAFPNNSHLTNKRRRSGDITLSSVHAKRSKGWSSDTENCKDHLSIQTSSEVREIIDKICTSVGDTCISENVKVTDNDIKHDSESAFRVGASSSEAFTSNENYIHNIQFDDRTAVEEEKFRAESGKVENRNESHESNHRSLTTLEVPKIIDLTLQDESSVVESILCDCNKSLCNSECKNICPNSEKQICDKLDKVPCTSDRRDICDKLTPNLALDHDLKEELTLIKSPTDTDSETSVQGGTTSVIISKQFALKTVDQSDYVHSVGKSVNKKQNQASLKKIHYSDAPSSCQSAADVSPDISPCKGDPLKVLEDLRMKLFEKAGAAVQTTEKPKQFESKLISSKRRPNNNGKSEITEKAESQSKSCNCKSGRSTPRSTSHLQTGETEIEILEEVAQTLNIIQQAKRKTEDLTEKVHKPKRQKFEKKKFLLRSMFKQSQSNQIHCEDQKTTPADHETVTMHTCNSEIPCQSSIIGKVDISLTSVNESASKQEFDQTSEESHRSVVSASMDHLLNSDVMPNAEVNEEKSNTDTIKPKKDDKKELHSNVPKCHKPKSIKCQACNHTFKNKELMRKHYPCRIRQTRRWSQNILRPNRAYRRNDSKKDEKKFKCQLPKNMKSDCKHRPQLLKPRKTKFRRVKGKRRRKLYMLLHELMDKRKIVQWPHLSISYAELSFKEQCMYKIGLSCSGNSSEGVENYSKEEIAWFESHRKRQKEIDLELFEPAPKDHEIEEMDDEEKNKEISMNTTGSIEQLTCEIPMANVISGNDPRQRSDSLAYEVENKEKSAVDSIIDQGGSEILEPSENTLQAIEMTDKNPMAFNSGGEEYRKENGSEIDSEIITRFPEEDEPSNTPQQFENDDIESSKNIDLSGTHQLKWTENLRSVETNELKLTESCATNIENGCVGHSLNITSNQSEFETTPTDIPYFDGHTRRCVDDIVSEIIDSILTEVVNVSDNKVMTTLNCVKKEEVCEETSEVDNQVHNIDDHEIIPKCPLLQNVEDHANEMILQGVEHSHFEQKLLSGDSTPTQQNNEEPENEITVEKEQDSNSTSLDSTIKSDVFDKKPENVHVSVESWVRNDHMEKEKSEDPCSDTDSKIQEQNDNVLNMEGMDEVITLCGNIDNTHSPELHKHEDCNPEENASDLSEANLDQHESQDSLNSSTELEPKEKTYKGNNIEQAHLQENVNQLEYSSLNFNQSSSEGRPNDQEVISYPIRDNCNQEVERMLHHEFSENHPFMNYKDSSSAKDGEKVNVFEKSEPAIINNSNSNVMPTPCETNVNFTDLSGGLIENEQIKSSDQCIPCTVKENGTNTTICYEQNGILISENLLTGDKSIVGQNQERESITSEDSHESSFCQDIVDINDSFEISDVSDSVPCSMGETSSFKDCHNLSTGSETSLQIPHKSYEIYVETSGQDSCEEFDFNKHSVDGKQCLLEENKTTSTITYEMNGIMICENLVTGEKVVVETDKNDMDKHEDDNKTESENESVCSLDRPQITESQEECYIENPVCVNDSVYEKEQEDSVDLYVESEEGDSISETKQKSATAEEYAAEKPYLIENKNDSGRLEDSFEASEVLVEDLTNTNLLLAAADTKKTEIDAEYNIGLKHGHSFDETNVIENSIGTSSVSAYTDALHATVSKEMESGAKSVVYLNNEDSFGGCTENITANDESSKTDKTEQTDTDKYTQVLRENREIYNVSMTMNKDNVNMTMSKDNVSTTMSKDNVSMTMSKDNEVIVTTNSEKELTDLKETCEQVENDCGVGDSTLSVSRITGICKKKLISKCTTETEGHISEISDNEMNKTQEVNYNTDIEVLRSPDLSGTENEESALRNISVYDVLTCDDPYSNQSEGNISSVSFDLESYVKSGNIDEDLNEKDTPPVLEKVNEQNYQEDYIDDTILSEDNQSSSSDPPTLFPEEEPMNNEAVEEQYVMHQPRLEVVKEVDYVLKDQEMKKPREERHFLDVLENVCPNEESLSKSSKDKVDKLSESKSAVDEDYIGRHFSDVVDSSVHSSIKQNSYFPPVLVHENREVTLAEIRKILERKNETKRLFTKDSLLKLRSDIASLLKNVKAPVKKDPVWLKRDSLSAYRKRKQKTPNCNSNNNDAQKNNMNDKDHSDSEFADDETECSDSDFNEPHKSNVEIEPQWQGQDDGKVTKGGITDSILQMLTSFEDTGNVALNMSNLLDILAKNLGFSNKAQKISESMASVFTSDSDSDYSYSDNVGSNGIRLESAQESNVLYESLDDEEPPCIDDIPLPDESPDKTYSFCMSTEAYGPVHDTDGIANINKVLKKDTESVLVEKESTTNNATSDDDQLLTEFGDENIITDIREIKTDTELQNSRNSPLICSSLVHKRNYSVEMEKELSKEIIAKSSDVSSLHKSITQLSTIETDDESNSGDSYDDILVSQKMFELKVLSEDVINSDVESDISDSQIYDPNDHSNADNYTFSMMENTTNASSHNCKILTEDTADSIRLDEKAVLVECRKRDYEPKKALTCSTFTEILDDETPDSVIKCMVTSRISNCEDTSTSQAAVDLLTNSELTSSHTECFSEVIGIPQITEDKDTSFSQGASIKPNPTDDFIASETTIHLNQTVESTYSEDEIQLKLKGESVSSEAEIKYSEADETISEMETRKSITNEWENAERQMSPAYKTISAEAEIQPCPEKGTTLAEIEITDSNIPSDSKIYSSLVHETIHGDAEIELSPVDKSDIRSDVMPSSSFHKSDLDEVQVLSSPSEKNHCTDAEVNGSTIVEAISSETDVHTKTDESIDYKETLTCKPSETTDITQCISDDTASINLNEGSMNIFTASEIEISSSEYRNKILNNKLKSTDEEDFEIHMEKYSGFPSQNTRDEFTLSDVDRTFLEYNKITDMSPRNKNENCDLNTGDGTTETGNGIVTIEDSDITEQEYSDDNSVKVSQECDLKSMNVENTFKEELAESKALLDSDDSFSDHEVESPKETDQETMIIYGTEESSHSSITNIIHRNKKRCDRNRNPQVDSQKSSCSTTKEEMKNSDPENGRIGWKDSVDSSYAPNEIDRNTQTSGPFDEETNQMDLTHRELKIKESTLFLQAENIKDSEIVIKKAISEEHVDNCSKNDIFKTANMDDDTMSESNSGHFEHGVDIIEEIVETEAVQYKHFNIDQKTDEDDSTVNDIENINEPMDYVINHKDDIKETESETAVHISSPTLSMKQLDCDQYIHQNQFSELETAETNSYSKVPDEDSNMTVEYGEHEETQDVSLSEEYSEIQVQRMDSNCQYSKFEANHQCAENEDNPLYQYPEESQQEFNDFSEGFFETIAEKVKRKQRERLQKHARTIPQQLSRKTQFEPAVKKISIFRSSMLDQRIRQNSFSTVNIKCLSRKKRKRCKSLPKEIKLASLIEKGTFPIKPCSVRLTKLKQSTIEKYIRCSLSALPENRNEDGNMERPPIKLRIKLSDIVMPCSPYSPSAGTCSSSVDDSSEEIEVSPLYSKSNQIKSDKTVEDLLPDIETTYRSKSVDNVSQRLTPLRIKLTDLKMLKSKSCDFDEEISSHDQDIDGSKAHQNSAIAKQMCTTDLHLSETDSDSDSDSDNGKQMTGATRVNEPDCVSNKVISPPQCAQNVTNFIPWTKITFQDMIKDNVKTTPNEVTNLLPSDSLQRELALLSNENQNQTNGTSSDEEGFEAVDLSVEKYLVPDTDVEENVLFDNKAHSQFLRQHDNAVTTSIDTEFSRQQSEMDKSAIGLETDIQTATIGTEIAKQDDIACEKNGMQKVTCLERHINEATKGLESEIFRESTNISVESDPEIFRCVIETTDDFETCEAVQTLETIELGEVTDTASMVIVDYKDMQARDKIPSYFHTEQCVNKSERTEMESSKEQFMSADTNGVSHDVVSNKYLYGITEESQSPSELIEEQVIEELTVDGQSVTITSNENETLPVAQASVNTSFSQLLESGDEQVGVNTNLYRPSCTISSQDQTLEMTLRQSLERTGNVGFDIEEMYGVSSQNLISETAGENDIAMDYDSDVGLMMNKML